MRTLAWIVIATAVTAGCSAPIGTSQEGTTISTGPSVDPVVIAVLDTGTSPYYPLYAAKPTGPFGEKALADAVQVEFGPLGDPSPRERDMAIWETLRPGVLYQFAGTRLFGISFDRERDFPHVYDAHFHGAATTYFAAREAPDAVIVAVQVDLGACFEPDCLVHPSIADGMEWIAEQPWIDIVSISIGLPGNPPDDPRLHPDMDRYLRASQRAAESGKILVTGAGNDVSPTVQHYFSGPPWFITVGGIEPDARGEHVRSSKTVDVVANFTDFGPMYGDGEADMAWRSGTSFATPIVAGTLADALGRIRAAGATSTPKQLRDALNASATYFELADWDPSPPGREPFPDDFVDYISLPIVSQAQMGWGYVDARASAEIARRVLDADFTVANKEQAALFQPEWQSAREAYWAGQGYS